MPARSIAANIEEWVADEVQLLSFTDDLGYAVYPTEGLIMVDGQPRAQTPWRVTISIQTGLLSATKVFVNHGSIDRPDPLKQEVRDKIKGWVEELRQARTKVCAPQNGHGTHIEVKGRG